MKWTFKLDKYKNFHPLRLARTAKSISSTVVLSFHPPASFSAEILHTPAVPIVVQNSINYQLFFMQQNEVVYIIMHLFNFLP